MGKSSLNWAPHNGWPGLLFLTPYTQQQMIAPSQFLKPVDQVILHTLVNEKWHDVVIGNYFHHTKFVCRVQVSLESRSTGSGL